MDSLYLALLALSRHQYDESIEFCDRMLEKSPYDQAAWFTKVRALTLKDMVDDTDMEEEGIADLLMDENAISQQPRPGTSLHQVNAEQRQAAAGAGLRPMAGKNRPLTGFVRPATSASAAAGGSHASVESAFASHRAGTSRPVSVAGRYVRLGTQSMLSGSTDGRFIQADRLDLKKYVRRPALAKALCDYLIYVDHNAKKALELCALATVESNYKDWWWKARLGKSYYQLGMLREAQQQFRSAIEQQNIIGTTLELAKVFIRLDQPNSALDAYMHAAEEFPRDTSLIIGCARVCEAMNDVDRAIGFYKQVLHLDSSNVEAIASLASYNFYTDQPEIALRYYRRLLQMGVANTELWNNIGLCCFYSAQYDMALGCFDRALFLAEDNNMADVWYNIGQVGIGIGDLNLAQQCFKIAISVDSEHAESYNNLGVLELRRGNKDQAHSYFELSGELGPHLFEPLFNGALLADAVGNSQASYDLCKKALEAFPGHADTKEQIERLEKAFVLH